MALGADAGAELARAGDCTDLVFDGRPSTVAGGRSEPGSIHFERVSIRPSVPTAGGFYVTFVFLFLHLSQLMAVRRRPGRSLLAGGDMLICRRAVSVGQLCPEGQACCTVLKQVTAVKLSGPSSSSLATWGTLGSPPPLSGSTIGIRVEWGVEIRITPARQWS